MDPAQYRDATRAAAEDARDPELADAIIEEEEEEEGEEERPTEEEEEERPTEETRSVTVGDLAAAATAPSWRATTAAVPACRCWRMRTRRISGGRRVGSVRSRRAS